jgi:redox-sensitive bicupin YhaK (pirin superfamily)
VKTKVFVGEYQGLKSAAKIFSEMVGAEFTTNNATINLELDSTYEYGVLNVGKSFEINGQTLNFGELAYIPVGNNHAEITSGQEKHFLLLGGKPFKEKILMWWNFIARTHEEIVEARQRWNSYDQSIPDFADEIGHRIPAPELPNLRLNPR